jgi:hypothetical protein
MSRVTGAGFYSSLWGPLPFSIGASPAERYLILEVIRETRLPAS